MYNLENYLSKFLNFKFYSRFFFFSRLLLSRVSLSFSKKFLNAFIFCKFYETRFLGDNYSYFCWSVKIWQNLMKKEIYRSFELEIQYFYNKNLHFELLWILRSILGYWFACWKIDLVDVLSHRTPSSLPRRSQSEFLK